MKIHVVLIVLIAFFASCEKKNVFPSASSENLVILMVGDSLEAVYMYHLESTELLNDSLPIFYESSTDPNSTNQLKYWKFGTNTDTLFISEYGKCALHGRELYFPLLYSLMDPIPFESSKIQLINYQSNNSIAEVWTKVSKLAIVYDYRYSNPTSKIGIVRQVVNEYDESLGITIPAEKYLIILAK